LSTNHVSQCSRTVCPNSWMLKECHAVLYKDLSTKTSVVSDDALSLFAHRLAMCCLAQVWTRSVGYPRAIYRDRRSCIASGIHI
jgi:hypothetical protein